MGRARSGWVGRGDEALGLVVMSGHSIDRQAERVVVVVAVVVVIVVAAVFSRCGLVFDSSWMLVDFGWLIG